MGSPLGCAFAELYTCNLENKVLQDPVLRPFSCLPRVCQGQKQVSSFCSLRDSNDTGRVTADTFYQQRQKNPVTLQGSSVRPWRHKCREVWPNAALEQTYTAVVLDGGLLVVPLLLLLAAYLSIGRVLGRHIREERNPSIQHDNAELVQMNVDNISKTSCSSFRTFSIRFGPRPKNGHTHEQYRTAAETLEVDADHVAETSLSTPFRSFSIRFRPQTKHCPHTPRDHLRSPRDATCQESTTPPPLLADDPTEPNLREMALQSSSAASTPSSWRAGKRPNLAPSIAGSSSTATTPCENGHRPKQQQPQQQDQGCRRSSVGSFNQMSQPGSPCSFSKTGCRSALVYLRNSSRTSGSRSVLRKSNTHKSLKEKKRVIKMLFVVVLEFFLCWTPLYVLNTLSLFAPHLVYQNFGMVVITAVQLLAYLSSCCNPITYCFMNAPFRKAFLDTIACRRKTSSPSRLVPRGSRRFFFR
ncbi:uncharacterized protein LOC143018711 [Oratosquilla oratoria]|uniref:uncharacterized protein LOC143018711 n=1 Tax=Oratosquilla oratoria TaxID=337810 RepID=UPI003F767732